MPAAVLTEHCVLVVEDDHALRDVLARGLRDERFAVMTAADGAGALRAFGDHVDAAIVDVRLPDADGRDVCQALRARGVTTPVLFLTAHGGLHDRLAGFHAGGDDYVEKPFHVAELAARIRAMLRRAGRDAGIRVDDEWLDPLGHVLHAGSSKVALTPIEFRLLAAMMGAPGTVLRRSALIAAGWTHGAMVSENTLDQYVTRLRRKLRNIGSRHQITTVRSVGFQLS